MTIFKLLTFNPILAEVVALITIGLLAEQDRLDCAVIFERANATLFPITLVDAVACADETPNLSLVLAIVVVVVENRL